MFPVGLLEVGERGEIVEIRSAAPTCGSTKCDCRVEDLGLRVGKTVEMMNKGGQGPVLLKVDESRIALARGMAMKIIVRRKDA